jgi:hypothetical protein
MAAPPVCSSPFNARRVTAEFASMEVPARSASHANAARMSNETLNEKRQI